MYEIILAPLATFMVLFIAAVVKWAFRAKERLGYSLVLFLLSMMASMLASAVIYFSRPELQSLEIAASLSFAVMTFGLVGVLLAFMTFRRGAKPGATPEHGPLGSIALFRLSVIVLVLLNELLMGWSFSLISGLPTGASAGTLPGVLNLSLNSYWFTLTMAAEMLLTLYYFRKRLRAEMRVMLFLQAVIMFMAPPALAGWRLSTPAVYAGNAAMVLFFIYIFDHLYRHREPSKASSGYMLNLVALYSLMMAALFYWGASGNGLAFGLTLVAEMILFFDAILRSASYSRPEKMNWHSRGWWTFSLLALLFISEYFMAAITDVVYYGVSFLGGIHAVPLTGSFSQFAAAALFDFIEYVAIVTGSAWFYVMMGVEMGSLVVMQIGHVRQLETKVRLALVAVAYSIYTVLLPYFFISSSRLPHLPFVGWNMGVGTSGAFAPAFLVGIGGTYLISGALAFLFGGRQVCSLFCSAALMYQGTFYDASKSFNRRTVFARKTHGNRLGKLFGVTASVVWSSIFATVLISYLDSVGVMNLSVFGVDPVVFAYTFYFDFLWYVVFISIPFIGSYACVTTGMCHWGMFNQFIGRLGLFRLKVRDRTACVNCRTKDCASACPVGLTAMPGKFIGTGEFKNYKCIGIGQCVSACPVDNIFFYDARHWFSERIHRKKVPALQNVLVAFPRGGREK